MSRYSINRTLDAPFSEALVHVKAELQAQGFGVLSEIDVQSILKEKLGKEIPAYTILGVCNPKLASQAIDAEPTVGVFLPCTVLVREANGQVHVDAQDPALMESFIGNPALGPVSQEAKNMITLALDALTEE